MSDKVTSVIICTNCKREIPNFFEFGSDDKRPSEVFGSCNITGLNLECPYCGQITGCDKSNMKFDERDGEGRVFHEEGKDTF